jgi:hypothetical protein
MGTFKVPSDAGIFVVDAPFTTARSNGGGRKSLVAVGETSDPGKARRFLADIAAPFLYFWTPGPARCGGTPAPEISAVPS